MTDTNKLKEQLKEVALEQLVQHLATMEDNIANAEALFNEKINGPKKQAKAIREEVLRRMAESNQSNIRFDHIGTVTRAHKTNYSITDPALFHEYVLGTGDLSMFGATLLVGGINSYKEANDGEVPPGVTSNTAYTLSFRKAK